MDTVLIERLAGEYDETISFERPTPEQIKKTEELTPGSYFANPVLSVLIHK